MVEREALRRLGYQLLLLALAGAATFAQLLPLRLGAASWPAPDLLLVFAFAWVLRRPDYVPVLMVGVLLLIADMLFLRPPGLQAAAGVLGLEVLRRREPRLRDAAFMLEWLLVAAVMTAMTLGVLAVQALAMVEPLMPGLALAQLAASAAAYPPVAWVSAQLLGVRRPSPGERARERRR